jgi:uncharacterized protein YndB with AHSA1/START domain
MNGKHQIRRSLAMAAPPDLVWGILEDSTLLPTWAAAVEDVACRVPGREEVGSVRECRVDFAGRKGTIVERCVEMIPKARLAYVVDEDSLGFTKLFADYGFTITVESSGDERTTVSMDTYYSPRGLATAAMNALIMRRRFATTIDGLLGGLRSLAEERALSLGVEGARAPL